MPCAASADLVFNGVIIRYPQRGLLRSVPDTKGPLHDKERETDTDSPPVKPSLPDKPGRFLTCRPTGPDCCAQGLALADY